jgi:hypothetical protein
VPSRWWASLRLTWSQIRRRGLRSLAVFVAVFVAAAGFTVLTSSSSASRMQTVGTVNEMSATNYDILVRPPGARTRVEKDRQVIQPGFLTGTYGGITLEQWHRIQAISGVEVAAPLALVGYAVVNLPAPVDLTALAPRAKPSVTRVQATWSTDNGLSTAVSPPDFVYATPQRLKDLWGSYREQFSFRRAGAEHEICPFFSYEPGSPDSKRHSTLRCMSWGGSGDDRSWDDLPRGAVGTSISFPFPFLIAAVDPASEEALSGLSRATGGDLLPDHLLAPDPNGRLDRSVPVVIANAPATQAQVRISIAAGDGAAVRTVERGASPDRLRRLDYRTVAHLDYDSASLYPRLIDSLKRSGTDYFDPNNISQMLTVTPPEYVAHGDVLAPRLQPRQSLIRQLSDRRTVAVPPLMDDTRVRLSDYARGPDLDRGRPLASSLRYWGTFDPAKLKGLQSLTDQILSGLADAPLTGADHKSRDTLGDQPLAPAPNPTGLAQPPPLMITSLGALAPLQQGWYAPGRTDSPPGARTYDQPISAIRVRVAGVTGIDETSRERVRLVAQRIHDTTGLDIDVTIGASAYRQRIDLPAGELGRPQLRLEQWWAKKGVATTILNALDRKSLALFTLVLLVSALSVANSAIASVRARRKEIGVLACLGWRRRDLFGTVLRELLLLATLAGLTATLAALAIGHLIDVPITTQRSLLALPAALTITLGAGLTSALIAARISPMQAIRNTATTPNRPTRLRTVPGLGLSNLRRTPGRTALAATGLAIAVAAFTVLLCLTLAFQGAAVGTLMGHAVTVQVRTIDYAATIATLTLAVTGVATVLILNIRDRAAELATLQSIGWTDRSIATLITAEGTAIALLGLIPGLALGLATATALTHTLDPRMLTATALAALACLTVTATIGLIPYTALRRLPTAQLLSEETA